jgi:flavin-dependent dehydrogenase
VHEDNNQSISIFFGKKDRLQEFEADFVVGAFGVNTYLMNKIKNMGFGYRPPSTLTTYQAELKLGSEKIGENFGNSIHVYIPRAHTIRYATVIPKEDFITITLIGKKNATKDIFDEFLNLRAIRGKIPRKEFHCFCSPKITVSPAKRPFTHRFVIIGDASFSRHYKNGIESAFNTARLAAETAIFHGVDASSLREWYYKRAKKMIIHDNVYGRFLFFMNDFISSIPLLTQAHLSLAKKHNRSGSPEKVRLILWNMFTGNLPYRDIIKISLNPKLQLSLLFKTIVLFAQKIFRIKR